MLPFYYTLTTYNEYRPVKEKRTHLGEVRNRFECSKVNKDAKDAEFAL